jgi:acetaldehyde dehydrogenase (acetylating)
MKKRMRQRKTKVAIIGTGNIGTDLLIKIQRSKFLTCTLFTGQNADSPGIKRARALGVPVSADSVNAIINNPDCCDIVFDATSAAGHRIHAPILRRLKKFTIDMTPSKIGMFCVPLINLSESLQSTNVNMISCGGQANIPLIAALMRMHPRMKYVEVVSSIASKSAGIGTRRNIDEYTQATSDAIESLTRVKRAKTIIILNPADPPILMHNTIYAAIDKPDLKAINSCIRQVTRSLQKYVPGFRITLEPVYESGRVILMSEVVGRGDFLPVYAGNLDIINCAGIAVAEQYARRVV